MAKENQKETTSATNKAKGALQEAASMAAEVVSSASKGGGDLPGDVKKKIRALKQEKRDLEKYREEIEADPSEALGAFEKFVYAVTLGSSPSQEEVNNKAQEKLRAIEEGIAEIEREIAELENSNKAPDKGGDGGDQDQEDEGLESDKDELDQESQTQKPDEKSQKDSEEELEDEGLEKEGEENEDFKQDRPIVGKFTKQLVEQNVSASNDQSVDR